MTSLTSDPENPLPLDRPRIRRTMAGRTIAWLRANLFASISSSIMSLLLILVLGKALFGLVQWGIANAIWVIQGGQTGPCRAIRGIGACWAVIPEKYRFILFGTYPFNEQWRPALATLIFIALFYLSTRRSMWGQKLILAWVGALILIGMLMWGGIFDLLTTAKTAIIDPAWQSFSVEVYVFVALIYFAFCFAMSRYSRRLEAQDGHKAR